jgi:tRNA A64-2'-O-ribosylphosphate transferase
LLNKANTLTPIPPTTSLYVTDLETLSSLPPEQRSLIICLHPEATPQSDTQPNPYILNINLGPHKLGSRNLRTVLPPITSFISKNLTKYFSSSDAISEPSTIIACKTGREHSIGIALALLCLLYNSDGQLCGDKQGHASQKIDKLFIRQRLSWIMTAFPDANPSGATLQSVNSFLMQPPR